MHLPHRVPVSGAALGGTSINQDTLIFYRVKLPSCDNTTSVFIVSYYIFFSFIIFILILFELLRFLLVLKAHILDILYFILSEMIQSEAQLAVYVPL